MLLQNAYLSVEISEMGAELMRIFDRRAQRELLWWGDPTYWKRRSPVLFPNVGKTFANQLRIGGAVYPTSQHGFARDRIFACEGCDETSARFLLKSDAESKTLYPFDFELCISYALDGPRLNVLWSVRNLSESPMPFTIGGHPAFCFDGPEAKKEDYLLRFPGKDSLSYLLLDPASGTALPEDVHALPLANGCLRLSDALFARDALIFDGGQIEEVWLCAANGTPRVGMICPGFPNYGVWSVQGAPFVCLEPWMGRADNFGFDGEFADKPGVNTAAPGESFTAGYSIVLPE